MAQPGRLRTIPRSLFVFFGLLGAGLFYSFVFDDAGHLEDDIRKLKEQVTAAKAALNNTNNIIANKQKFEAEYNTVSEQFKAAVEFLPESLREQELLHQISDEARASGVYLVSMKASRPDPKRPEMTATNPNPEATFYEEVAVDVELEGSYALLTTFLAYISKLNRIVNIKNCDLMPVRDKVSGSNIVTKDISTKDSGDTPPQLILKGTLVAYRFKKEK